MLIYLLTQDRHNIKSDDLKNTRCVRRGQEANQACTQLVYADQKKTEEKGGGIPFLLKSLEHPECYAPQQNQQTLPPYCLLTVH